MIEPVTNSVSRHLAPPDREHVWPAPSRGWYAVIVLMGAACLSFMDRQLLSLLVMPIEQALDISDIQISLLIGASFALSYSAMSFPLGWLADRAPRNLVSGIGILLWSLMTAACGMAGGFGGWFIARMGVGLGEACLSPAAYSLIADSFPPRRMVRALGIFTMGALAGLALAYLFGGYIVERAEEVDTLNIPVIGRVAGWRLPFFIFMAPGLVVGVAALFIREPRRRRHQSQAGGFRELVKCLSERRWSYICLFGGMATQSIVAYAIFSWTPTLLHRRFDWPPASAGLAIGLVIGIFGISGNLFGAWLAGWLLKRGLKTAFMTVCFWSSPGLIASGVAMPLMNDPFLVIGFLAPAVFCVSMPTALAASAIQVITPGYLRGQVSAIYLFVSSATGLLAGPTAVALFTDYLFADRLAIGWSVASTIALAATASAIFFWCGIQNFGVAVKRSNTGIDLNR